MFGAALLLWLGVCLAAAWALRVRPAHSPAQARRIGARWLIGGGLLLPSVAILALLLGGSPAGFHQLPWPGSAQAPLRVEAIGHQWWWEIHYPDTGVRLRNEMRIPVGRAVDVHTRSSDVIHSFWVPRLGGKLDAVPGRTLVLRLQADQAGLYRGVCAEFCGSGHAHMGMTVQALPAQAFDDWLLSVATRRANAVQEAPAQPVPDPAPIEPAPDSLSVTPLAAPAGAPASVAPAAPTAPVAPAQEHPR